MSGELAKINAPIGGFIETALPSLLRRPCFVPSQTLPHYPKKNLEFLREAARVAYGSGFCKKTNGGRGNIGILKDPFVIGMTAEPIC